MTATGLPEGWSLPRLDQIARVTSGKRLPKGQSVTALATPHPYIRVTDMRMGKVDLSNIHYVPEDVAPTISRYTVDAGDLYISCAGTLGIVGLVPEVLHGANLTENANRVSGIHINPHYLLHVLMSEMIQGHIQNIQTVGAQPKLALGRIRSFEIPCPDDPKEQEAIAEALSDADALIEGLERLIAKKRLIKQGAMQDLLTAKRRLPEFSGEWSMRKFGEIAGIRNQKIQTLGDLRAEKCIELEQIEGETGRLRFWTTAADRTTTKYLFAPGDVLFGRLRPYLRKYFLAVREGVCSTEIWPLMALGVTSNFLYHVVQSDPFVAAACESYGTHMPRADWGKLLTFELNVPEDSTKQDAIGSVLVDMDAEVQALETRLGKARQVKEGMMQNLLTGRIRLV